MVASIVLKHGADALRELIEEGQVDFGERLKRGQFDDRLGLSLEEHRQHDDAHLPGLAETGGDGDEIRRHVGEQDALLFHRALAGEALAQLDGLGQPLALVRIAREQLELGVLSSVPPRW